MILPKDLRGFKLDIVPCNILDKVFRFLVEGSPEARMIPDYQRHLKEYQEALDRKELTCRGCEIHGRGEAVPTLPNREPIADVPHGEPSSDLFNGD